MPIVAKTSRLTLRSWQHGDRVLFKRHCNTHAVMKYLGKVQSDHGLNEDVAWFKYCWSEFGHTLWVVERTEDSEFLGFAGLDLLDRECTGVPENLHGGIEIGWRLREDAWGKGYATEAAIVCLDIAFRIRRFARVVSRAAAGNGDSIRIMEKLGMSPSIRFKPEKGGVIYEIDRKTWFAESCKTYR